MSTGSIIYAARKKMGITQQKLAEMVDVTPQTISYWENDEYQPNYNKILKLSIALQVPHGVLISGDNLKEYSVPKNDRIFDENHMSTFIKTAVRNMPQSLRALQLMKTAHQDMTRKGSQRVPYINHPLNMACHALAMGIEEDDVIATILLHDVIEDTDFSLEDLPVEDNVKEAVDLLTRKKNQSEAEEEYYSAISQNRIASIVKLIDRCNNISLMATGFTPERMHEYIEETEEFVLPLLEYVKHTYPEYYNATFLLKYQMRSVIESIKRLQ